MCAGRQVLTPRRLITHREPGHRELSRERGAGGQSQCLEHLLYELGSESIPVRLFRLREAYSSSRAVLSSCKGGVNDFAMRVLRNVKLQSSGLTQHSWLRVPPILRTAHRAGFAPVPWLAQLPVTAQRRSRLRESSTTLRSRASCSSAPVTEGCVGGAPYIVIIHNVHKSPLV
jgi:hypothetical protein